MQALAFEVLTPESGVAPALQARLAGLLARAAGHVGMAGGQAIDLASIGKPLSESALRDMHRRKTGALLQASVLMGAACGNASEVALQALSDYGAAIGLAFQVVDDILDVTQESHTLGKTAGKDQDNNKPTYVSLMGLDAARRHAFELRDQAQSALARSALREVVTSRPWRRSSSASAACAVAPAPLASPAFICASAMITEAILSFIGAGTPPIIPSWGNIMAEGRALWQVKPYIVFFPAVFLSITVLAVNLLGDGLRDALDPRTRKT